ncbi:MAG: histidine--tRNA ligase [Candidatus Vogelbacteria bacterium]|nr:histidine--tRNA ligase [Candidatus Vogelbacteria bacterium]
MKKKTEDREEELRLPKGMRDIFGDEYYAYQGFFEKAAEIALYYGFTPIETPVLERESLFTAGVGEGTDIVDKEMYTLRTKGGDRLALRPEGTPPIMRAYFERGLQAEPQPVLLYYYGPFFRHDKPQRGRYREFHQFGLESLGSGKSISDAMIIKLFMLILQEAGLKDLRLEINTIGDKECRPIFKRELTAYYRKHLRDLCDDCRERLKNNPLRLLDCKNPRCQVIKQSAPNPISYLCGDCKAHFKEVLEYLEMMGLPYEINNNLVRGMDYYSRTVFEISENLAVIPGEEVTLPLTVAGGGRYDYLARALGNKKEVSAVGGAIGVERVMLSPNFTKHPPRLLKKPKVFFIQLSFEAKLKSFEVIEILRRARIPIAQSISKDSLGAQLGLAEKCQVPYSIILGQKEAVDGTVIVRNMQNRSQDIVPVPKLAEYLKNIK